MFGLALVVVFTVTMCGGFVEAVGEFGDWVIHDWLLR